MHNGTLVFFLGCGIQWENGPSLLEQSHSDCMVGQIKDPTKTLSFPPTLCLSRMPSPWRSWEEMCSLPQGLVLQPPRQLTRAHLATRTLSPRARRPGVALGMEALKTLSWLLPVSSIAQSYWEDGRLRKHRRCYRLEGPALHWGRPRQACE